MLNMLRDKRFQGTKTWKKFYQYSANKDYELFSEQLKLLELLKVLMSFTNGFVSSSPALETRSKVK